MDLVKAGPADAMPPATPTRGRVSYEETGEVLQSPQVGSNPHVWEPEYMNLLLYQEVDMIVTAPVMNDLHDTHSNDGHERKRPSPSWGRLPDPDYVDEALDEKIVPNRKHRSPKSLKLDSVTQISRDELLQWDRDYLEHMTRLDIQKAGAKCQAQAKKNAISWVTGRGIGSVGTSMGNRGFDHPLKSFCGDSLLAALSDEPPVNEQTRKRSSSYEEGDDHTRNVRQKFSNEGLESSAYPYELARQEVCHPSTYCLNSSNSS